MKLPSTQIDRQNRTFRRLMTAVVILVTALLASSITLLVIAFVLWLGAKGAVSNDGPFVCHDCPEKLVSDSQPTEEIEHAEEIMAGVATHQKSDSCATTTDERQPIHVSTDPALATI